MDTTRRPRAHHNGGLALVLFLALAAMALAACADKGASPSPTGSPGPSAAPLDLQGTTWRAIRIRDAKPIAGSEPTITFDGDQAGGTTGCNTYGGTVTVGDDGAFSIESIVMTEMACDGAIGNQEAVVVEVLDAADHIALVDGELTISGSAGEIVLAEDPR